MSKENHQQLIDLITEFPSLFSDTPLCTDLIFHDIDVDNSLPNQQRPNHVSLEKQEFLEAEVKYLLNTGFAKPSYSSWASPCILVAKPERTYRFCTDYRKLNSITEPNSFLLPRMEDCIDSMG